MIDTKARLSQFLPQVQAAPWIALDTEADSLHAYPEKLCLLQISLPESDDLIDPLAHLDLQPLFEALRGRELILHGADYDLRLLKRIYSFVPNSIFDTMEAARLIGSREFGLVDLVKHYLGVTLEKGPQKANWAQRPLTDRMQHYACNDTHYLKPIADILRRELQQKARLSWLEQTCTRLVANCAQLRAPDPDLVWRLSGSRRLHRAELAVLRELWHWRETEAIHANKPPYFILSHETLIELALAGAASRPLAPLLPKHFSMSRKTRLMNAIAQARSLPPAKYPHLLRSHSRRTTDAERRRQEALKKKRDHVAHELGLDPTLIASRATMEMLAGEHPPPPDLLMEWQKELLQ